VSHCVGQCCRVRGFAVLRYVVASELSSSLTSSLAIRCQFRCQQSGAGNVSQKHSAPGFIGIGVSLK